MEEALMLKKIKKLPVSSALAAFLFAGVASTATAHFEYRIPLSGMAVTSGTTSPQPPVEEVPDEPASPQVPEEPAANVTVTLTGGTLPAATVGLWYRTNLYAFLSIEGEESPDWAAVSWQTAGSLPQGLNLPSFGSSIGSIEGYPAEKHESGVQVEVTATYKGVSSQQTFTLIINGNPLQVKDISTGILHSCAVTPAGAAKCWGLNSSGQLGDNSKTSKAYPVTVTSLSSGVNRIYAGSMHTCALMNAGTVKCWGSNAFGQLGDGTNTDRINPVDVPGLSNVVELDISRHETCALLSSGGVKCWGRNAQGQLGVGDTIARNTPTDVSGLTSGVQQIVLGGYHACALMTTGTLKCWGGNSEGQLGNGTGISTLVPADIPGVTGGVYLAAGEVHSCIAITGGSVKCWGRNSSGQLGNGSTTGSAVPVLVSGISGVSKLSASDSHTCAVQGSGSASCWGANTSGQLGNGTETDSSTPQPVVGHSGLSQISVGGVHTCARAISGDALCWGANAAGQLGLRNSLNKSVPTDVYPN